MPFVCPYRNAPVCYFQLGHDDKAYDKPEFGQILGAAIRWSIDREEK